MRTLIDSFRQAIAISTLHLWLHSSSEYLTNNVSLSTNYVAHLSFDERSHRRRELRGTIKRLAKKLMTYQFHRQTSKKRSAIVNQEGVNARVQLNKSQIKDSSIKLALTLHRFFSSFNVVAWSKSFHLSMYKAKHLKCVKKHRAISTNHTNSSTSLEDHSQCCKRSKKLMFSTLHLRQQQIQESLAELRLPYMVDIITTITVRSRNP